MNKEQRKELKKQVEKLESLKELLAQVKAGLAEVESGIDDVKSDEEYKLMGMERLSGTPNYKKMESVIDRMSDVSIDVSIIDPDDMARDIDKCIAALEFIIDF